MLQKFLVATAVIGLVACDYSTQPGDYPPNTVAVTGVGVAPQTIVFEAIGETRQVTATIAPLNATDKAIEWETSNAQIATVDANGLVTARGIGDGVFVTAFTHDGHKQASVNVSVQP